MKNENDIKNNQEISNIDSSQEQTSQPTSNTYDVIRQQLEVQSTNFAAGFSHDANKRQYYLNVLDDGDKINDIVFQKGARFLEEKGMSASEKAHIKEINDWVGFNREKRFPNMLEGYQGILTEFREEALPLSKKITPSMILPNECPKTMDALFKQNNQELAMKEFRKEFRELSKINPDFIKKLRAGGTIFTIASATSIGYTVGTSENKLETGLHEGTVLLTGLGGGYAGGLLGVAATPFVCGPGAPACAFFLVLGSTVLGGSIGERVGEYTWRATRGLVDFYKNLNFTNKNETTLELSLTANPLSHPKENIFSKTADFLFPPAHAFEKNNMEINSLGNQGNDSRNIENHAASNLPQELINSQNQIKEMNEVMLPLVEELMQAWTDVSIEGFEKEEKVVQLKNELDTLKENSASPHEIFAKSKELKDTKAKIILERQQFDQILNNGNHILNSARSLAVLTNQPELAMPLAIADAALNTGALVAGFCGYGSLAAGINPFMAVSTVLGCIANIAIARRSQKDSSQLFIQQLLIRFHKEMHERFDEVMQGISDFAKQELDHFLSLKSGQEILSNKIDSFERKSTRNQEKLISYSQYIANQLNQIIQEDQLKYKEKVLLEIRENVNKKLIMAKEGKSSRSYYDEARAEILNYIKTPGSGISNNELIGDKISLNNIEKINQFSGISPYFYLNTLVSYSYQFNFNNKIPAVNEVHEKLTAILNNQYKLTEVIKLGHLTEKQPSNEKIIISSLDHVIKTELPATEFLVMPIYVNARWSLLLLEKTTQQAYYFTLPNCENINTRISSIISASGFIKNVIINTICSDVTPYLSATWLIESIKKLVTCANLTGWAKEITALTITQSIEFTKHESVNIYNPLILKYLTFKLLELIYAEHPDLGEVPTNVSHAEFNAFYDIAEISEAIYKIYTQLCNRDLFEQLLSDYQVAINSLGELLKTDLNEYNNTISTEFNMAVKEIAKNVYYNESIKKNFCDGVINISVNYGNWFSKSSYRDYINSEKSKNTRKGQEWGNNDSAPQATQYINRQTQQILTYKKDHLNTRQSVFNNLEFKNQFSTFGLDNIFKIEVSPYVFPTNNDSGLPILPAPDFLLDYILEAKKQVIITAVDWTIGYIYFTYEINNSVMYININLRMQNEANSNLFIARLAGKYDPSFYAGNEAIWWYWAGGKCVVRHPSRHSLVKTENVTPRDTYYSYAMVPQIEEYLEGIVQRKKFESLFKEDIYGEEEIKIINENVKMLKELIANKKNTTQIRYAKELTDKFKISEKTNLHEALAKVELFFNLLKMFTAFLFPASLKNPSSVISQFFTQTEWVSNRTTAFAHLLLHPEIFITNKLISDTMLKEFSTEIHRLINDTMGLSRIAEVDELQNHLLNCLNDIAQNVTQLRTSSEKANFYEELNKLSDLALAEAFNNVKEHPENAVKIMGQIEQLANLKKDLVESFEKNPHLSLNSLLEPVKQLLLTDNKNISRQQKPIKLSSSSHSFISSIGGKSAVSKENLLLQLAIWLSSIKFSDKANDERELFGLKPYEVHYATGNCLFEAVAAFLDGKTGQMVRELSIKRIKVDEQLQERINALATVQDNPLRTKNGEEYFNDVEEYIKLMNQDRTWGTEIELVALARELQRPIAILTPDNIYDQIIQEESYAQNEPIFLNYINENHYEPLAVPGNQDSREILEQIQESIASSHNQNLKIL